MGYVADTATVDETVNLGVDARVEGYAVIKRRSYVSDRSLVGGAQVLIIAPYVTTQLC